MTLYVSSQVNVFLKCFCFNKEDLVHANNWNICGNGT